MIRAKNLWKSYGNIHVLKGLDLEITEGETLVILGRSGIGKSVLLRQIIGIEKPDKGFVEIDGVDVSTMSTAERFKHQKMGMLFQGAALFDSMTVGDNVAFYLFQHQNEAQNKEMKQKVEEVLKRVGLEGSAGKMPSDLSGGMKKRAALARLIIYGPKIILYDEPTTGLDPITSMHINELILQTQKELNATSIVVTHDIKSAFEVGDRLAFINEGKIEHIAPKKEFMEIDDPLLRTFFKNAMLTSAQ